MSGGPEDVAQAFVTHFYQSFDSNVESLAGLYVRATTGVSSNSDF